MRNNNFFAIELRTCVYSIFIINKGDEALPAEKELRKHRCCFSGHRPEKMLFPESIVKAALARSIQTALADGFTVFISGMARGVDLWAAELVIQFREAGLPVRLIWSASSARPIVQPAFNREINGWSIILPE